MIDKEFRQLVQDFGGKLRDYNGWVFDYEYPGYLVYHQGGGDLDVYFTPDWDEKGSVSIQINKDGDEVYSEGISYVAPLKPSALFRIVRPYLDLLGAITR